MKNNKIYRSIGEVAKEILVNTHTLRFWEKEFKQIRPKILAGKRRYYDETAIEILKKIKYLLKEQGMTINGVKKVLNNKSLKLDEISNDHISINNIKIINKIKNISNLVKQIKKLK